MQKRCYYEVLEVERDADGDAVKRAYRKQAMRYHPDRNPDDPGAEERFKECAEAYAVLSDGEQRRAYDMYGHQAVSGQGAGNGFGSFDDIFGHFGDILGDIFGGRGGGRGRSRGPRRGADLRVDLEITFEEAVNGVARDVTFERHDVCEPCDATGAKPGTRPEPCGACNGSGRIARQQGFFMVQTTCPVCRGAGATIKEKCGECQGEGVRVVQRTLSVKIPAGIDAGMRLRVPQEGETGGPNSQRGDLGIVIHVAAHERFQRDGAHIHVQHEISFAQAALGDDLTVETVHGPHDISIPPGTQPGTVVRLRNRGMPRLDKTGNGDQFVTLGVRVPETLTPEQATLIEQLKAANL